MKRPISFEALEPEPDVTVQDVSVPEPATVTALPSFAPPPPGMEWVTAQQMTASTWTVIPQGWTVVGSAFTAAAGPSAGPGSSTATYPNTVSVTFGASGALAGGEWE